MPSISEELADLVTAKIASGQLFSRDFTPKRSHLPKFDLTDLVATRVEIVPGGITIQPGDRSRDFYDVAIDIGVIEKLDGVGPILVTEVDALKQLVEELIDHLRRSVFTLASGSGGASWISSELEPLFDSDRMDAERVFFSVARVTYRTLR